MDFNGVNEQWLEKLKSRCDIVSVLSKYIKLEKKGKTYWSCCPFHHEKTPSFAVNQTEQYFHCFGCKESGDVIKFVQLYESVDFLQAVQILADSVKMEMPSFASNDEIYALKQKKQILLDILKETNIYYEKNLKEAKEAVEYLKNRQISNESIKKFSIGFSKNWDELPNVLRKLNFSVENMKDAGVVESRTNGGLYDVMAERLTFPIYNAQEQIIGFSARILKKVDYAKYKNTMQTLLFNKSKAIFAINHIKKEKQQGNLKNIIIVEGQIDVISMHEAGFVQTVACLGTALTKEHARELKRYSDDIILCFDGDSAGKSATNRTIETLKEFEFNIKIAVLEDGKDPDEFLKIYGKEQMSKLLENAKPVIEYMLESKAKMFDLKKPEQKSKYIKTAIEILNQLETFSQKQIYLETVKKISGVPIDVLMRDITQTQGKKVDEKLTSEFQDSENSYVKAEKFLLASIIHKKPYVNLTQINENYFTNPNFKNMFNYIILKSKNGKNVIVGDLYNAFKVDEDENLKDVIYYNFDEIGNNANQYFKDSLWLFVERDLKEKQLSLTAKYNDCKSQDERQEILQQISSITKKLKNKNLEEF